MEAVNGIVIATVFYFPAAMANVGAVISGFVPLFNKIETPVDLGLSFRGIRLVGDHKKIGGFLFGIVFGILVAVLKFLFFDRYFPQYRLVDFSFPRYISMYTVMSFGAVSGDIVKSILKRQFGIAPHSAWIPFDIDHSSLGMFLASVLFGISWTMAGTVIVIYFFWHILANIAGFYLKIKKVPYWEGCLLSVLVDFDTLLQ